MKFIKKLLGFADKEDRSAEDISKTIFGLTDVGRERDNNEDYFLVNPKKNLYIVSDGMGGHQAGEIASMHATETANDYFNPELISQMSGDDNKIEDEMKKSLFNAHQKVNEMAEENSIMGSTIVVAFINGNSLHLCHVGDSRAYVCDQTRINLLTIDHSNVMDLVKAGKMTMEEARISPIKNALNQAVGSPVPIKPDYNKHTLKNKDKVLLCSDGLWDMLTEAEIFEILRQEKSAKTICEELIKTANNAGGHDNITVIVIEHRAKEASEATESSINLQKDQSPEEEV